MTIATESVSESEIENVNQAEDHPSGNGNRNGNVNGNESGIVGMNVETLHIAQDIKNENEKKRKKEIRNIEETIERCARIQRTCRVLFKRKH